MKIACSLTRKCNNRISLLLCKIGETLHTMVMCIGIKQYALSRTKEIQKGMSICVGRLHSYR